MRIRAIIGPLLAVLIATGSCQQQEQLSDLDGDGIPDTVEMELGYDHLDADSDDDGILDGIEDWNWDGVVDAGEANPLDPDTDDDGMCDGPRRDNDGDGMSPEDPCTFPTVRFVDWRRTGQGYQDGRSWATAFATLQLAIDFADEGAQIWVAGGTYYPLRRNQAVASISKSVQIRGGFFGIEQALWQRSPDAPPTVLSGDFSRNDFLDQYGDNSGPVVRIDNADDVLLAELVVTGGRTDEEGGGISLESASVTMYRVQVSGNAALYDGGGIAVLASDLVLRECLVEGNTSSYGGGVWLGISDTVIEDSVIRANEGDWSGGIAIDFGDLAVFGSQFLDNSGGSGGAIGNRGDVYLQDTKFIGNHARVWGGAVLNYSDMVGVNLLVAYNSSSRTFPSAGGGISNEFVGNLRLAHATIAFNEPSGLYHEGDSLKVENSIIWGNGEPGNNLSRCAPGSAFCAWTDHSINYVCSADDLDALYDDGDGPDMGVIVNSIVVASDPFDVDPETGYLYLNPDAADTGCLDAGSNAIADAAIGADVWRVQTTRIDGLSEMEIDGIGSEIVDLGTHY